MKKPGSPSLKQIATILLVLVAWFALSNHCVLGACASAVSVAKGCPMHMKASDKAPPKQNDANQPCCKSLRAVAVTKICVTANTINFVLKPVFTDTPLFVISQPICPLLALDTGPPDALTFSETVLQQSILAHAPPLLV